MASDYKTTQPYQLGLIYAELGAALMDPNTDLRDLVALSGRLGMRIELSVAADDPAEDRPNG